MYDRNHAWILAVCVLVACKREPSPAPGAPSASASAPSAGATTSIASAASPSTSASAPTPARSPALAIVQDLCDRVGSRLACSDGDARAVAWAEAKMRSLGLANVRAEKVMVPCWSRGAATASIGVAPSAKTLQLAALGGSISTSAELDLEVAEFTSVDALEKLPAGALKGKIAFLNGRTERTRTGEGYGKAVGARYRGPSEAAKKGAAAFLLRSISTADDDLPHTGATRYFDDAPKIAAAALGPKSAEALHDALTTGPTRARVSITTASKPDAPSANVVGEITGTATPPEFVVIGAHLDSWDLGAGAQDDGAGVAIVLETARQLAIGKPHRRTIRVVLYANEENGTRGAKGYAEAHAAELPQHVAALEADEGAGSVIAFHYLADPIDEPTFARLAAGLTALGVAAPVRGEHAGTDISALAGVPLFDLSQDASKYFDVHHAASDVPASIDAASLEQAVRAWVSFVGALADDATPLHRAPPPKKRG